MKLVQNLILLFISCAFANGASESESESKDRYLSLPKLDKCNSRTKEFQFKGRNFFYSGHDPELKDKKYDWLDARNACRDRCMETVSFENQEKFDFFKSYIEKNNISFIWTSGRLCDFAGCEGRWDLLPKRIKGWLWSGILEAIAPTNKIPPGWDYQPWSFTGIKKRPQPDNAEFYLTQTSESCLGILNNMYNDSVAWHDIACYHRARFICEDSDILLKEVHEQKDEENIETTSTATSTSTATTVTTTTTAKTTTTPKVTTVNDVNTEPTTTDQRVRKVIRKKLLLSNDGKKDENVIQSESSEKQFSYTNRNTEKSEEITNNFGTLATEMLPPLIDENIQIPDSASAESHEEEKIIEQVEVTTVSDIPRTTNRVTLRDRKVGRNRISTRLQTSSEEKILNNNQGLETTNDEPKEEVEVTTASDAQSTTNRVSLRGRKIVRNRVAVKLHLESEEKILNTKQGFDPKSVEYQNDVEVSTASDVPSTTNRVSLRDRKVSKKRISVKLHPTSGENILNTNQDFDPKSVESQDEVEMTTASDIPSTTNRVSLRNRKVSKKRVSMKLNPTSEEKIFDNSSTIKATINEPKDEVEVTTASDIPSSTNRNSLRDRIVGRNRVSVKLHPTSEENILNTNQGFDPKIVESQDEVEVTTASDIPSTTNRISLRNRNVSRKRISGKLNPTSEEKIFDNSSTINATINEPKDEVEVTTASDIPSSTIRNSLRDRKVGRNRFSDKLHSTSDEKIRINNQGLEITNNKSQDESEVTATSDVPSTTNRALLNDGKVTRNRVSNKLQSSSEEQILRHENRKRQKNLNQKKISEKQFSNSNAIKDESEKITNNFENLATTSKENISNNIQTPDPADVKSQDEIEVTTIADFPSTTQVASGGFSAARSRFLLKLQNKLKGNQENNF